jgi:XTP/dITP diphosphohydrolase
VAFSCKGRGVCPSCNARRMVEVAAHLNDHVLPPLPIRQWVLSVPKRIRPFFHHDPALLADDSGLVVDALGGAPGVSKRFSGRADLTGAALDRTNNDLLLQRLEGIPLEQRTARYVCAAVLSWPHEPRQPVSAIGTCEGLIATAPEGDGGFGYDPLFLVPDLGATFGTLPPDENNRRSHRGRAFRTLALLLEE